MYIFLSDCFVMPVMPCLMSKDSVSALYKIVNRKNKGKAAV